MARLIRALLWDIDGTLLNFKAAEKAALKALFQSFDLGECTDDMVSRYTVINDRYWKMLEKGEMEKPKILVERFRAFFETEGVDASRASEFNAAYQLALGDTIIFCDHGDEIVRDLKGKIPQYAVTNGTLTAQTKKLKNSGLDLLLDGAFISDQIGFEKPDKRFFEPVFEELKGLKKDEILIIGDSLTSDMQGGVNAGIQTCWYHPKISEATNLPIDHEIRDLHEIYRILEQRGTFS